jgi:hypothetical protein
MKSEGHGSSGRVSEIDDDEFISELLKAEVDHPSGG